MNIQKSVIKLFFPSSSPQQSSLDNSVVTCIKQLTKENRKDDLTLQMKLPPPLLYPNDFVIYGDEM
jgi:hypothetical protein